GNRDEPAALVEEQEGAGDQQERRADRQPAAAWHGDRIDPAGLRSIDDLVADNDAPDHRRENEGEDDGEHEHHDDRPDGIADGRDEGHRGTARAGEVSLPALTRRSGGEPGSERRSRGPRPPAGTGPSARRAR